MELIQQVDNSIFYWINHNLSNVFFDYFLVFIRNKYVWLPLYLFLISFLIINFKNRGLLILAFVFLTVGISDFISSSVIKPSVERVRPCNDIRLESKIISRVKCGHGYSFPSSHATNHFALGVFFFLIFASINKKLASLFILWASLISFAQIYVGVHYPFDVLAGSILGTLTGYLMFRVFRYSDDKLFGEKV